jgi:hypothetical protein
MATKNGLEWTRIKNFEWVQIKENASVCYDGEWITWPPKYTFLKTRCKVDGPIRKRARMKLKMHGLSILAWLSDLRLVKDES